MNLVLLDLSQNNIDNIAQRFLYSVILYFFGTYLLEIFFFFFFTMSVNTTQHFLFQIIPAPRELTGILNPHTCKQYSLGTKTPPCPQTVNLTGNRLPNLHGRTFDGNVRRTLRNLYLAHNLLTSVPRFCDLEKLWHVFLAASVCAYLLGKLQLVWRTFLSLTSLTI